MSRSHVFAAVLICAVLFGALQSVVAASPVGQAANGPFKVFLPMTRGNIAASPTTPGPTTPPAPTPPPTTTASFFLNKQIKNNSADIEIDARGGMHAAYAHFVPTVEDPRAVYTFCTDGTSACTNAGAWRSVQLGNKVREVQLELTPAGQPRLLIVSEGLQQGREHFYAACDQNCGDANAWSLTSIVTTYNADDILDNDQPQRSFAIAPDGHPAFLYNDRNYQYAEPDKYGTYYATCYANCADKGNWRTETQVSITYWTSFRYDYEVFKYSSLTFTNDGKARFVARVFALNRDGSAAPNGLYYYGCDAECHLAANWNRKYLLPTGDGTSPYPGWDLAMAGDRPRIALATGSGLEPAEYNHQLLYIFCEADCLGNSEWLFDRVVTATNAGKSPDVEVDAQGRPRVAWVNDNGDLAFAWCNTGCHDGNPTWQNKVIETEATLRPQNPQAIPSHCRNDLWSGLVPVLAIDAASNPRIVYDVTVDADCYYDTTPGDPSDPPTVKFEPIWRGVHVNFFPQP